MKAQILKVVSGSKWMSVDYKQFEEITQETTEVFRTWDDEIRGFKELVRDQVKRRGTSERPPHKITCEHALLQERIDDIRQFRKQHKKLQDVIEKVSIYYGSRLST